MTRGQIVLITNDAVYTAGEFNGDMYYDGYGKQVIERLKSVESYEDYYKLVDEFNAQNFEYPEQIVFEIGRFDTEEDVENVNKLFDMSKDYFKNWFSDYLYIKNISTNEQEIVLDDDDWVLTLKPGEICSLCFGNIAEDYDGNKNIQKRLKENIVEAIESLGWSVEQDEDYITIEQWSPAGEDICEEFDYSKPLVEQAKDLYNYFNPDEHAAMWFGQGRGEPSGLQELLDDAKEIKLIYQDLWVKLIDLKR